MADFEDLGFEEASFDDLGFEPEAQEQAKPTTTDSFLRGARDVGLSGFGDELSGGIGSLLELLPGSSTRQDETLRSQGFDLPQSPTYKSIRDEDRAYTAQAEATNPNAYLSGGLTAGIATAPLLGTASSVGQAAKIGAGLGGLSGLGTSTADTASGMLADTAVGAGMGAGLGSIAQAAPKSTLIGALGGAGIGATAADEGDMLGGALKGAGIGTIVGGTAGLSTQAVPGLLNKMGGTLARNYNFAKDTGLDVFNKETSDALAKSYGELVEKVKTPFVKKQEQIQKTIQTSEKQLNNMENLAKEHSAADKQFQISMNDQDKVRLAEKTLKIADKLQSGYAKTLTGIKKNYDRIENQIPKEMQFDISDEILGFKERALQSGGLPAENIRQFFNTKDFRNLDFMKMTAPQVKKFREDLQGLKTGQGTMSAPISELIDGINVKRLSTLDANPETAVLSKELSQNDAQYSKAMRLQDNYIDDIVVNKQTGQVYGKQGADTINNKTIDTIKSYLNSSDEKKIKNSEQFLKALSEFDPELAQQFQNEMTGYVAEGSRVNAFTPTVQSPSELISQNPEAARIQELLNQLKNKDNKLGLKRAEKLPYTKDVDAIDTKIRDNLQNMNDAKESGSKSEMIKSILQQYKKLTGEDITPEATKAVEGYVLSGKTDVDLPNVAQNPINQALSIGRSAGDRVAGAYGRMESSVQNNAKASYVNQRLTEATQKGKPALDAARFDLLQQPAFRQILKDRETDNKEEQD